MNMFQKQVLLVTAMLHEIALNFFGRATLKSCITIINHSNNYKNKYHLNSLKLKVRL